MTKAELRWLARIGAEKRLGELRVEIGALLAAFPELQNGKPLKQTSRPKRRRRTFSAAERASISRRMRRYWAKRRAEEAN